MTSKSEERRLKSMDKEEDKKSEVVDDGLQPFSYPTLGGAVIRAKDQAAADKIAAKLTEDLKTQEAEAKKKAEAEKSEA